MELQEQERAIQELEVQLDRLRALYEQYFMGIERIEPHVPRKNLERSFHNLRRMRFYNTALRFRFQQLIQRYNTMQTYWRRVCRQIEEGTYRRDIMRAKARTLKLTDEDQTKTVETEEEETLPEHEINLDDYEDDTDPHTEVHGYTKPTMEIPTIIDQPPPSSPRLQRPHQKPPPRPRPPVTPQSGQRSAPPTPPASPLPDSRIHDIYRDYISARQHCNQSTLGLTLEKVAQQIRNQEKSLRNRHGKAVDFQVTIQDGKAIIRAFKKVN